MAPEKASIVQRQQFLTTLCRAFLSFGAPTHDIAEFVTDASRALGIQANLLCMPWHTVVAFGDGLNDAAEVRILNVEPGIEMGRLMDVFNLYRDLVHEHIEFGEASKRLDSIMTEKLRFSLWTLVLTYGVGSAFVATSAFRGGFLDMPVVVALAGLVGLLEIKWMPLDVHFIPFFEVLAGAISAFAARALGSLQDGELFCFGSVALSSIVFALPGFMVLSSCVELHTNQIITGGVRLVGAITTLLYLGFGLAMGTYMYGLVDGNATTQIYCKAPVNQLWYILLVPAFAFCQCVLRQAKWRQFPPLMVIAVIGFFVNNYAGGLFGSASQIPGMLGALSVGLLSNLHSMLYKPIQILAVNMNSLLSPATSPFSRLQRRTVPYRLLPNSTRLTGDAESASGSGSGPGSHPWTGEVELSYRPTSTLSSALMLQAVLIQVPTSFSIRGFLEAGSAVTGGAWGLNDAPRDSLELGNTDVTFFSAFLHVIQGVIGIAFGLLISNAIMYPFGRAKRVRNM